MRRRKKIDAEDTGTAEFEVRDGDRLTVQYMGAKLSIAQYSTVELDAMIYSRSLDPGDDPDDQFEQIYEYLERHAMKKARAKLEAFSSELAKARRRVRGD